MGVHAYLPRECMIMTIPIQRKQKCDMKIRAFVVPEETQRQAPAEKEQLTQIQGKKRKEKMKRRILTSPH